MTAPDTTAIRAQMEVLNNSLLDDLTDDIVKIGLSLCDDVERLRAENERLRSVLTKINVGEQMVADYVLTDELHREAAAYSCWQSSI